MATSCCTPTHYFFNNQASTSIAYDTVLQQKYGSHPKVVVMYRIPETGEYYVSSFFTPVSISGGVITFDHGGVNSGLITIS